jgi:hypothetical protein
LRKEKTEGVAFGFFFFHPSMVGEVRAPTKVPYVSAVAHHKMVDKTDPLRILFFEREDKLF